MSVRVNLLPEEVHARGQANRTRILAGVLVVLLVGILAALSLLQRSSIGDAEDRLAAVEQQNAALQADIAALQPFADLEGRANTAVELVGDALSAESSLAAVLQDLSTVMPPNAQIDTLSITLPGEAQEPASGGARLVYGQLLATGQVLDGVAPGVERLIIDLERVAAFDNAYVTTSTVDDEGVATFSLEVDLGPEMLTERYVVTDEAAPGEAAPGEAAPGEAVPGETGTDEEVTP